MDWPDSNTGLSPGGCYHPSPLSGHLPTFWLQPRGSKVWLMQTSLGSQGSCPALAAHLLSMQDNKQLLWVAAPDVPQGTWALPSSVLPCNFWPSSRAALNESFPQIILGPQQPRVEETQAGAWEGAGIPEPSLEQPHSGWMCLQRARGFAAGSRNGR